MCAHVCVYTCFGSTVNRGSDGRTFKNLTDWNQPQHRNHWQLNLITLIIWLQCNNLLISPGARHSCGSQLNTNHPSKHHSRRICAAAPHKLLRNSLRNVTKSFHQASKCPPPIISNIITQLCLNEKIKWVCKAITLPDNLHQHWYWPRPQSIFLHWLLGGTNLGLNWPYIYMIQS